MIVTPEYVRTHYTSHDATKDASIEEVLRMVHGNIEGLIGQPIEETEVVWYFEGRGYQRILQPYTLNASLVSVEEQPAVGEAWEELDDVTLTEDGYLESVDGFAEGGRYRATLTVGLPAPVDDERLSESFTTSLKYGDLLHVICEMTAVRMTETKNTTAGENRLGVQAITINSGGTARTTTLRNLNAIWDAKLRRYRTRITF